MVLSRRCVAGCAALGVVVSGASDGTVLLHSLRKARFIRTLLANSPEGGGRIYPQRLDFRSCSTSFDTMY